MLGRRIEVEHAIRCQGTRQQIQHGLRYRHQDVRGDWRHAIRIGDISMARTDRIHRLFLWRSRSPQRPGATALDREPADSVPFAGRRRKWCSPGRELAK